MFKVINFIHLLKILVHWEVRYWRHLGKHLILTRLISSGTVERLRNEIKLNISNIWTGNLSLSSNSEWPDALNIWCFHNFILNEWFLIFSSSDELDSMSSSERISFLQDKLQEIRKYYMSLKSEVASIDRRRKRLKKKEREGESSRACWETSHIPYTNQSINQTFNWKTFFIQLVEHKEL